jgi:diphthamide synthase (EF-2-diphthine--ammonia ligase)
MDLQAEALRVRPLKLRISELYGKSYREAISKLTKKGIEGIVTGDIYIVDGLLKR